MSRIFLFLPVRCVQISSSYICELGQTSKSFLVKSSFCTNDIKRFAFPVNCLRNEIKKLVVERIYAVHKTLLFLIFLQQ